MMISQTFTRKALLAMVLGISSLPVFADQPEEIQWQQLPAETQETLAPMEKNWDKLKPRQQHMLMRKAENKTFKDRAERWKQLSPEERERIAKARKRFREMPPEQRKALRKRWENMSAEEKRAAKQRRLKKYEKNRPQDRDKKRDKNKQNEK